MEARKHAREAPQHASDPSSVDHEAQELKRTPLWNAYYQRVRRSIRFPRYYRKALNW
jgi:hypothetical protein